MSLSAQRHVVLGVLGSGLPDNVLVFEFDDATYDPSSLTTLTGAVWTQLSSSPNVWQWDARGVQEWNWNSVFMNAFTWNPSGEQGAVKIKAAGNLTKPMYIGAGDSPYPGMFRGNLALTDVCLLKFPNVTYSPNLFNGCQNLNLAGLYVPSTTALNSAFKAGNHQTSNSTRIGPITTSSALQNVEQLFYGWIYLTEAPYFQTAGVVNMASMFYNCQSLTSIPLYDTTSAQDVRAMLYDCRDVESGALALYQQMSTQATPPSQHTNCFANCGSDTVTGAAELAQIPASWGGTGA